MNDDYVHGINKMKKPATKVMAPPGGQTSINLFGGPEAPQQHHVNKNQAHRNQSSIFGSPEQKAPPAPTPAQTSAPAQPQAPKQASKTSNQAAPASSQATASNAPPVTGTGKPSTKVMAPPGGKTSINLFG